MYDLQWEPLAEIYLYKPEYKEDLYCLCSRSFVRNKHNLGIDIEDELSLSESEFYKDDIVEPINIPAAIKAEVDTEVVSCYCSASHTDNISTDEHDSLKEVLPLRHKGLHSSDSGTDLTEHIKPDNSTAWNKYWSNHGERLIWESWITKYSDYINPGYLQNPEEDSDDLENTKAETSRFSFDKKDIDRIEPNLRVIDENNVLSDKNVEDLSFKNRFLVRNLSGSDSTGKLNADNSEGWNPLSPLSIDCETEAERLISSRCGSHASCSVRTVDSMTNVTRMTVSSIELSESSKNSESFSSVSSVQSSLSSSSEDIDGNIEYDSQWNGLWKSHYETEYLLQYRRFMSDFDDSRETLVEIPQKTHSMKSLSRERRNSNNSSLDESEDRKSKSGRTSRKNIDTVEQMLNQIKMSDTLSEPESSRARTTSYSSQDDFQNQAVSLGLPTSFGTKKLKKQEAISLGPEVNVKSDKSSNDRIKSAFSLIGLEMSEEIDEKFSGQIDYKMKHIRLQNKQLKFYSNATKPKHNYFDDDGNEVNENQDDHDSDEVLKQKQEEEIEDVKNSSTSNEEVDLNVSVPTYTKNEDKGTRKRKRKKKLALPSEIKENPNLKKFWQRRFSLFYKFDMGIKLDEESWYSVTPELVAKHTAERCRSDIIIDAFCGAGGNAIQFALTCERVIAIDIDPKKIELAKNNAEVYGVLDRIEFIVGDFLQLSNSLKADVVFLSPPWGGPSYLNLPKYDLETMLQPVSLQALLKASRNITNNVALFLPKNSNTYPLLMSAGEGGFVEIEQNFINKKWIAITAYYNELIKLT